MGFINSILDLFRTNMPLMGGTDQRRIDDVNRDRLAKYRQNWAIYEGLNITALQAEDGKEPTSVNYLKRNIDKINYFAFGKGFKMTHPRYQDALDLSKLVWGPQRVEKLLSMGQQGSVTGDAFIMVAPKTNLDLDKYSEADAEDDGQEASAKVRIVVLPSEYCTPFYDPFDTSVLDRMDIRIPFQVEVKRGSNEYTLRYQYMSITRDSVVHGVVDDSGNAYDTTGLVPQVLQTVDNPIKEVYVRHIRNFPYAGRVFGMDDVREAAFLNQSFTESLSDIRDIVSYGAAPIIAVMGAKAKDLDRGPNKVWSNLPKDAKVAAIESVGDLEASNAHLKQVKESLHEITGVPEIAQGSQQSISNTSGVALQVMYMPLLERADTKQMLYGPHLLEVAILALKWLKVLKGLAIINPETGKENKVSIPTSDSAWEDLRQNTDLSFTSVLPKDRLMEGQIQTALVTAGLQSKRRAIIALGQDHPDSVLKEIEEDNAKADARALKQHQEMMKSKQDEQPKNGDPSLEPTLDSKGSSIESGAGPTSGTNLTQTDEQRGRPRTQG
jgi:hypothetical protein